MGRRSTLVAFAAVALAALLPVSAYAAVPATNVDATVSASTVTVQWTPSADALDVSTGQVVIRDPAACGTTPTGAAVTAGSVDGAANLFVDLAVPNGTYCYYVRTDSATAPTSVYAAALSPATVNVDTTAPIANTPGVTPANPVHGVATITASSNDPTATNQLYLGIAGCDALTGAPIASPWNSATVVDGTYLICNVATDLASPPNISAPSAPATVIVDNTLPSGLVVAPAAGAFVRATVTLTSSAADTSGIRSVQYQHAATAAAVTWSNTGAIVNGPSATGFASNWVTTAAAPAGAGGDGPEFLRAVITDNAGNVTTTVPFAVNVDNTNPNVAPVLTAPPAVAGSPTMSWTAAHDANGISRYDVLRNGAVIGSVAADQGLAFSDKTAPDQQTLTYTVRAYDAAGNFATSNADSVLVDSTAVSAPRALTAATPTAAAPVLTWQPPTTFAVNHYDIYRDGLLLASTTTPALTYTDATAEEGAHDYAVLARNAGGQAGVLSASFKVIYDVTPPTSGGAPSATILATGGVSLAWPAAADALSGVAGYVVRRTAGPTPPVAADGGTAVCAPATVNCVDPTVESGLWSYSFFARDGAGNIALVGVVGSVNIVDSTPPLAPTKLKATRAKAKAPSTTIAVTLHWDKPTATDLARIVVVLNLKHAPKSPSDGKAVYKGLGTSAKVKLRPGQNGYFALYSYDHSENVSLKPARIVVKLASLIPLRPLNGSLVRTATPLLTWKPFKGTKYYNVQLFVNGKRVLVGWPTKASYKIPAGKLQPGTYVWYVWPALRGKKGAASFGKLIGRATFRYKK
jgi:hypothetical protein